jgi:transcriptional regulator with XRE-family HTH domain
MEPSTLETDVGARIRELRKRRGLSLRALAEHSGLSANAISLIERGETSPTLTSLEQLTRALGVPVGVLFQREAARVLHIKRNASRGIQYTGVLLESLGEGLADRQFEIMRLTIEPGAQTQGTPLSHPGQEYVYCLEGTIHYRVADQTYVLETGDSLNFHSALPHSWRNPGAETSTLLVVLTSSRDHTPAH